MYEHFKPKTIENTLRSLRHLENADVDLEKRDSFRRWIIDEKKKGTLDRTLNTYIKSYNRYLMFLHETKIKLFHEIRSPFRPVAEMNDYELLIRAANTFGYTAERKVLEIELLFKTGLRLGELSNITLDDLDGDILKVIGKGQKEARVFLPATVRKALDRYLKVRKSRGSNRILISGSGHPITYNGLRQEIYQVAKKADIQFSAHRARRFYARFLYKEGLDLEELRLLMRHEKIDTTKDYVQLQQDDALDSLRKKDIRFFEGSTPNAPDQYSTPRTGFEPVSRARQARMIGRYTIGAWHRYLQSLYKIIKYKGPRDLRTVKVSVKCSHRSLNFNNAYLERFFAYMIPIRFNGCYNLTIPCLRSALKQSISGENI